jgi:mRNA-degrading endonuclease YafQ of YafQ-DinJ toxin-antitoxin module
MIIQQTKRFEKTVKKLHPNQKADLDSAIKALMISPDVGELKTGDLAGVRVHKFKMQGQLTLLSYQWLNDIPCLLMLSVGSHENFYRNLKHYLSE